MSIRVKCKCGKSLNISSKHADKKLACPGCQKPFRIPAAKFAAAAAKKSAAPASSSASHAAAAPSSQPARAAASASGSGAPAPMSLDDELSSLGSGLIGLSQSDVLFDLAGDAANAASAAAPIPVLVETSSPVEVGYAADRRTAPVKHRLSDPIAGPTRSFWADAFVSFIYPVKSGTNVIIFVMIAIVGMVEQLAANVPMCFMFLVIFFIKGWFASLYFSVIRETAAGSEDLPGFDLEGGFAESIFRPALKFVGAGLIVMFPFVVLSILANSGVTPAFMDKLLPIWFLAGVFLMPMSFLLFALDTPGTILRLDLVLTTIAKTILPYLAIWVLLAIVLLAIMVTGFGGAVVLGLLFPDGLLTTSIGELLASIIGGVVISIIGIYLMLVAMRIIGLYYLHFKKRFAFELE